MPHTHAHTAAPPQAQPNPCPLCVMRGAAGAAPESIGRYSLAHGAQFRCSACDAWMCVDCGDRPSGGAGARCGACSLPPKPETPAPRPAEQTIPSAAGVTCGRYLKKQGGPLWELADGLARDPR